MIELDIFLYSVCMYPLETNFSIPLYTSPGMSVFVLKKYLFCIRTMLIMKVVPQSYSAIFYM